jgi:diguanylate cyclase (GGDEF)-like protein
MREHLDVNVLANWVCMLRSDVDGAIWIADDSDDARFYERCIHHKGRIVPAPDSAVALMRQVSLRGAQGVVATVRGSFHLDTENNNLFQLSVGDTTTLLIHSPGADRVLQEVCGMSWLRACEREVGSVRQRSILLAWRLDALTRPWIESHPRCLDVLMKAEELIEWRTFELAWPRVLAIFDGYELPLGFEESLIRLQPPQPIDGYLGPSGGRVVVNILAAATRLFRPRGIRAEREVGPTDLVSMFRAAFDLHDLDREPMYWRMRSWERENRRYPLLSRWRTLDPLQVLLDQRYWKQDLHYMLELLGSDEPLAAFKMDLDNFRNINNSLGHAAGDEAIRFYGSIVVDILGHVAEVYRRGGDEIVAFAPGLGFDSAKILAETLRADVEKKFRDWALPRGLESFPTASIGVTIANRECSAEEIERLVDEAQHEAKASGKNRVIFRP